MDISCPCVIPMTLHYDDGIPMALHLPMAFCYSNGLALCLWPCVMTLPLCYTNGFALYQWSCIMLTVLHLCQWQWLVLQHCPWPCIIPIYCVIPMANRWQRQINICTSSVRVDRITVSSWMFSKISVFSLIMDYLLWTLQFGIIFFLC